MIIAPLFYFRLKAILPPGHRLNNECYHYLQLFETYVASPAIQFFLCYVIIYNEDQETLKIEAYKKYGVYYERFWLPDVALVFVKGNIYSYSVAVIDVVGILLLSSKIFYFVNEINKIIRTNLHSEQAKEQQRQVMFALLTMVDFCFIFIDSQF